MSLLPIVLALAAPADQAEWWWVRGDPQDAAISFADAGSVRRDGDRASVRVTSVDRTGQTIDRVLTFRCPAPATEGPHRFACASDADRMNWAAMLGGTSPDEAARALFASESPSPVGRGRLARQRERGEGDRGRTF